MRTVGMLNRRARANIRRLHDMPKFDSAFVSPKRGWKYLAVTMIPLSILWYTISPLHGMLERGRRASMARQHDLVKDWS